MNPYLRSILAEFSPAWLRARLAERRPFAGSGGRQASRSEDDLPLREHRLQKGVRHETRPSGLPNDNHDRKRSKR